MQNRLTPTNIEYSFSGLDPAGLYFEQQDIRVRLDPEDALFVDAIHTDGEAITELGGWGSCRLSLGSSFA